jgi:hypothetical protein
MRLHQDNIIALFRQVKRRGKAGKSAADHADIAA